MGMDANQRNDNPGGGYVPRGGSALPTLDGDRIRTFPRGRVCTTPLCTTVLAPDNPGPQCSPCTEALLRGPAADVDLDEYLREPGGCVNDLLASIAAKALAAHRRGTRRAA